MLWLPNGFWNVIVTCCQPICYVWWTFNSFVSDHSYGCQVCWGRRGHDHMVVRFTTTYAISAYHHWYCGSDSCSGQGVQHYVIKFVSDLRQVSGFSGPPVSSTNKTDCHDITAILLKVVLNTIKPNQTNCTLLLLYSCEADFMHGVSQERKKEASSIL